MLRDIEESKRVNNAIAFEIKKNKEVCTGYASGRGKRGEETRS